MKKFLFLDFIPRSTDLGLLLLRIVFGVALLWLHGRGKLMNFSELSAKFPDPLGVGSQLSLVLAIIGEVVCPAMVLVGAFTRIAALGCALTMSVAFFAIHGGRLAGANNGEMAFLFLAAFASLFLAGGGRYSLDPKLGAKA